MAKTCTGAAVKCTLQFPLYIRMGDCSFSCCCGYHMGEYSNIPFKPRYNWIGCHNGWYSSLIGILLDNALVENAMAKLKYVFHSLLIRLISYLSILTMSSVL